MKLDFEYLKKEILASNAKSEYKQSSIVILREIFKQAKTKQLSISVVKCSCEPVKTKDENGNDVFVSPWCWKCNTWRNYI